MLSALRQCIGLRNERSWISEYHPATIDEKEAYSDETGETICTAMDFMAALTKAKKRDTRLVRELRTITAQSWSESLAKAIFGRLETTVRDIMDGKIKVGAALQHAIEKSVTAAVGFAKDHPIYCALIALGILVLVAPWVLEMLGFGAAGPVEGSFAALWQARYAGYVPKGSLFSFFQRLGMVFKH